MNARIEKAKASFHLLTAYARLTQAVAEPMLASAFRAVVAP